MKKFYTGGLRRHSRDGKVRGQLSKLEQRLLEVEPLESRMLLTSTLYVDFGDDFPVGGFTGTVATLRTTTSGVAGDPAVNGPLMDKDLNSDFAGPATDDEDAFTITSFNNRYTTDGGNYTGGVTQLRADMMSYVRRFFDPFDIDVIELTSTPVNVNGRMVSAASNLAEISSTLGANEAGVVKNNDAYVLMGRCIVHRPAADGGDVDVGLTWGGYANGLDTPSNNNNDNTALGFLVPGSLGPSVNFGFWGNLIAHEAGHLFGLQHSLTVAPTAPPPGGVQVSDNITQSEIMSYRSGNGYNFFSRYPMVRGNNNTNNNEDLMATSPPAPAANRTPYDQWINTASIGQNLAYHYITGTGADDIITIANAGGGNATISVQAFSDATYATALAVPGSAGASTTYSYSLALDRPFVVEGGGRNDRFIIDGDLGITLTVRGMSGTDELFVMGKNAASGTYTPGTNSANGLDGSANFGGSVVIGTTIINFAEFETTSEVTIQDLTSLTLRTPLSDDDLTVINPAAGQNGVTGSSDGVTMVPLTFFNVVNMTIDTGTNDGAAPNDSLDLTSSLVATLLQNLVINMGAGNDLLTTTLSSFALPVAGGGINFNGSGGTDEIDATANVSFNLSDTSLQIVGDASIALSSVESADLTGGAGGNTFTVSNWGGSADLNGAGGGDNYIVNFQGSGNGSVSIDDSGASGTDAAEVNGTGADDAFVITSFQVILGNEDVTYSGLEDLTVNGAAGDDEFAIRSSSANTPIVANGDDDDDVFNIGNLLDSINDILGAVTVNGNAPAASDSVNVNDQGSAFAHEYVITSTTVARDAVALITYGTVELLTVNGGVGGNDINVQSTASTTPVVVNAGSGDDEISVDSDGGPADPPSGTVDNIVSSLTINGQGGTNSLRLEDYSDLGLVSGDIVHVTPTQIGADPGDSFFGAGGLLNYSDLAHITLNLSNGYFPDTVYLIPSATTAFELHGNDPDCPMNPDQLPGDALYVDFTGVTDPLLVADGNGNASWTFSNREDVVFDGFEKLNHVGIIVVAPDNGTAGIVRVYDAESGALKFTFAPYGEGYKGGVRVAVGELNCDGIPDIITAAGPGQAPLVRVVNGVTGLPLPGALGGFYAYEKNSKAGVWVAAADINQDGLTDIITGPDNGPGNPGPVVKVFSGETGVHVTHFLAYDKNFKGGVRVAAGDINGDLVPDIVVAPGSGRAPLVRVYDGSNLAAAPFANFFAYGTNDRKGVFVAVGDVNGDGQNDIVTGGSIGSSRLVRVFDGANLNGSPLHSFQPYIPDPGDSVRVAVVDINGDGEVEVVTSGGPSGNTIPKVYDFTPNPDEQENFFVVNPSLPGGFFVGAGG